MLAVFLGVTFISAFTLYIVLAEKCSVRETVQHYTGWPNKTEQSIQSIFQDFALINSCCFSPCGIEHLFSHYNNTKIIKFG